MSAQTGCARGTTRQLGHGVTQHGLSPFITHPPAAAAVATPPPPSPVAVASKEPDAVADLTVKELATEMATALIASSPLPPDAASAASKRRRPPPACGGCGKMNTYGAIACATCGTPLVPPAAADDDVVLALPPTTTTSPFLVALLILVSLLIVGAIAWVCLRPAVAPPASTAVLFTAPRAPPPAAATNDSVSRAGAPTVEDDFGRFMNATLHAGRDEF